MDDPILKPQSYVYIAFGQKDGTQVMKVGKSRNPRRRRSQIRIAIEASWPCENDRVAYQLEAKMRNFVIAQGGIGYKNTIDWFEFDRRIYEVLKVFLMDEGIAQDEAWEIKVFQNRYQQIKQDEAEIASLRMQLQIENERIASLEKQVKQEEESLAQLQAEIAALKEYQTLPLEQQKLIYAQQQDDPIWKFLQDQDEDILKLIEERDELKQQLNDLRLKYEGAISPTQ